MSIPNLHITIYALLFITAKIRKNPYVHEPMNGYTKYPHNSMLSSHKNRSTDTWYNMNKPGKQYANVKGS